MPPYPSPYRRLALNDRPKFPTADHSDRHRQEPFGRSRRPLTKSQTLSACNNQSRAPDTDSAHKKHLTHPDIPKFSSNDLDTLHRDDQRTAGPRLLPPGTALACNQATSRDCDANVLS